MQQSDSKRDILFIVSMVYLCYDAINHRAGFRRCPTPIHTWLFGSYLILLALRMLSLAASRSTSTNPTHVLLDLRQKTLVGQIVVKLTWWVLIPLVVLWTAWGTLCIWRVTTESPQCMPSGLHFVFVMLWQLMCYVWIMGYCGLGALAWFLERRLQRVEGDLREIRDEDMESRWGQVSNLPGYDSLPAAMAAGGMTPAAIRSLPGVGHYTEEMASKGLDCSVCLSSLAAGDHIRRLCGCRHVFHRPCIDLWLLRSAECPLCKVSAAPKK